MCPPPRIQTAMMTKIAAGLKDWRGEPRGVSEGSEEPDHPAINIKRAA